MRIVYLYPGQGSQHVGMGKSLCQDFKVGQLIFEEANDTLGFNLKKLCFEGNIEELTQTQNAQPALLTVSYAAQQILLNETGIVPDYCAGHSLGEFTALTCGGALKFTDALKIVRKRGELMNGSIDTNIGTMAAIEGLDLDLITDLCEPSSTDSIVEISCVNSLTQIVVSGHKNAIQKLGEQVHKRGAKFTLLRVSAPFHCSLMIKAATLLREELLKYSFLMPKTPVISNVTALPYNSVDEILRNLTLQMTSTVKWLDTILFLNKNEIKSYYEIGSQKVLSKLIKEILENVEICSVGTSSEILKIKSELAQLSKHSIIDRCLSEAICIKNLNFDNKQYYTEVVEPYQKIKRIREKIEIEKTQPTFDQIDEALDLFVRVMNSKKLPINEQKVRFNKIIKPNLLTQLKIEKYSHLLNS